MGMGIEYGAPIPRDEFVGLIAEGGVIDCQKPTQRKQVGPDSRQGDGVSPLPPTGRELLLEVVRLPWRLTRGTANKLLGFDNPQRPR